MEISIKEKQAEAFEVIVNKEEVEQPSQLRKRNRRGLMMGFLLFLVFSLLVVYYKNIGGIFERYDNDLLIGISSTTNGYGKRYMIRKYQIAPWANSYKNVEFKFFVSNPTPEVERQIQDENAVHNDIIILRDIPDTREIAREVKPFWFFRYVEKFMGKRYKYVAKMDDDAYINVPLLMKDFHNEKGLNTKSNLVASMFYKYDCHVPMGWYYALSWDLVLELNFLFETKARQVEEEDFQTGVYLCQSGLKYTNTYIPRSRCADLELEVQPKDKMDEKQFIRMATEESICVHQLKLKQRYIHVAECMNPDGFNQTCIDENYAKGWDRQDL